MDSNVRMVLRERGFSANLQMNEAELAQGNRGYSCGDDRDGDAMPNDERHEPPDDIHPYTRRATGNGAPTWTNVIPSRDDSLRRCFRDSFDVPPLQVTFGEHFVAEPPVVPEPDQFQHSLAASFDTRHLEPAWARYIVHSAKLAGPCLFGEAIITAIVKVEPANGGVIAVHPGHDSTVVEVHTLSGQFDNSAARTVFDLAFCA